MMLTRCINLNIFSYNREHNKAILSWKINFALKILLYKCSNKTGRSYNIAPRKQIKLHLLCYILHTIRGARVSLRVYIYDAKSNILHLMILYISHVSQSTKCNTYNIDWTKKKKDRFRDATAKVEAA